jgi:hypothetical protein
MKRARTRKASDRIPVAPTFRPGGRAGGRTPPEPLAPGEVDSLRQVLRRLSGELRAALQHVPEHREGASALSRSLNVDRATAHRALSLAAKRTPESAAVLDAPGPDAMRLLLRALARRDQIDLASLDSAVTQYRRVVQELGGGSKSRLARRLAVTAPGESEDRSGRSGRGAARRSDNGSVRARRENELREQLFGIVSELLGKQTQTRVDLMICRVSPENPRLMDYAQVRGLIGHRAWPHAQPVSVELLGTVTPGPASDDSGVLTLDGKTVTDPLASTTLADFSTQPLPVVVSRGLGHRVRNVIDPNYTAKGNSVDVVVGYQRLRAGQHPAYDDVPALEVGAMIREPTRALVLDVWLHRDMIAGAVPSLETYVWSPTLRATLADHWLDRLPSSPLLQVLGRGGGRAATPAYARHAELTAEAFAKLGWNHDEFVGYRAEVEYPMWGGAYFAVFDYSK